MTDNTAYKISILGTPYTVRLRGSEDEKLEHSDGYCDWTTKTIVVRSDIPELPETVGNLSIYKQKVLRHEIVHAFLFESGLTENSYWAVNEELVDWIAMQFDKIDKAFHQADTIFGD